MKRLIITVGPALLYDVPIKDVHHERNLYRINGAHGSISDIEGHVDAIRKQIPDADILIDLPGNKVRTANFSEPIQLHAGESFSIPSENFNYTDFYKHLKPGMTAWANDSVFEFEVQAANAKQITFLSKSNGLLLNNKGVHIRGINKDMPFLFDKDLQLLELCNKMDISFAGLSFVRTASDILEATSKLTGNTQIIAKVETLSAVEHLEEILKVTTFILVDRGDLSTDIGVLKVPYYQSYILKRALYHDRKVFFATQILKNMELQPIPTIAEVDDLYSILCSGVYGIQMSEETAVGKYVRECVKLINEMNDVIIAERPN